MNELKWKSAAKTLAKNTPLQKKLDEYIQNFCLNNYKYYEEKEEFSLNSHIIYYYIRKTSPKVFRLRGLFCKKWRMWNQTD